MTIRSGVKFSDGTDDDGERRQVQLRPAEDPDTPAERALGLHRPAERQGRREQGRLHVRGEAGLPAVRLLPLQRRDRPAARLQQVQQDGPHDRQPQPGRRSSAPGRTRTSRGRARPRRRSCGSGRTDWWATKALGLKPAPKYVVDIHNSSNAAAFANFQAGNIDLFNNFAPRSAISGSAKTYYSKAPYHLGANTTWLFPNTTKKPLNDPAFRRALAYSVNMNQILAKSYQGLVNKASPTGLLPIWNKWVDKKAVAKYGFSYNPTKAKAILAAAGYKDTDGDGYVENKDGSDISLTIQCPNGWSDWMTVDPGHRRQCEGRRHQDHPGLPGLRDARRRSRPREVRPRPRQRPAVLEHAVDVLPVHLPAADPRQPDDGQLREVLEPEGVEPHAAAGQDAHEQPQGATRR